MYRPGQLDGLKGRLTYNQSENAMDTAEMACKENMDCIGIYDENCDKEGPFLMAELGFLSTN